MVSQPSEVLAFFFAGALLKAFEGPPKFLSKRDMTPASTCRALEDEMAHSLTKFASMCKRAVSLPAWRTSDGRSLFNFESGTHVLFEGGASGGGCGLVGCAEMACPNPAHDDRDPTTPGL